jgi:Tfp pilus assembly protein PilF
VVPPRDVKKRGVLATRAPHRPNPIGLSVVRLLGVKGRTLRVRGSTCSTARPCSTSSPTSPTPTRSPTRPTAGSTSCPPSRRSVGPITARGSGRRRSSSRRSRSRPPRRAGRRAPSRAATCRGSPSAIRPCSTTRRSRRRRRATRPAAAPLVAQALALQQAQRLPDAKAAFERALALDPGNVAALVGQGFLLLEPETYNAGAALLSFRRARACEPGELAALVGEGIARAALGDSAHAEPAAAPRARGAAGRREGEAGARGRRAGRPLRRGRPERRGAAPLRAGGGARARAGGCARAPSCGAPTCSRTGARGEEAEAQLRAALALDPESVRGHHLLAELLARRGATEEAKREARLHELFRQLRDHTARRFMQDVERRVALWREIAALYPAYARAPYELVREDLEGARWSDAQQELATLAKRDGATAELLYLTARAKAGAGDLVGAKAAADAMRRADPRVPAAVLRAVLDDWKKGNPAIDAATFEKTAREWLGGS